MKKILIVDDEEDILEFLTEILDTPLPKRSDLN